MLVWILLLGAAAVAIAGENIHLGDKWVKFVKENVDTNKSWSLSADQGSTIKVFCRDWRFTGFDIDEKTCQTTTPPQTVKAVFDDGVQQKPVCGSPSDLLVIGKSARMTIQLNLPPRVLGVMECMAKANHPPAYEEVKVKYGRGAIKFRWPETLQLEQEKAWRFTSDSNKKLSMQCEVRSAGRERNGACVYEVITLDSGEGPKETCDYYKLVKISNGTEITLRAELYAGYYSLVDCTVQAITGPSPNEHENVQPPAKEDSSEIGVVPGKKGTTCDCGRTNKQSSRLINATEVAQEGKYPFMVSLRSRGDSHFCGASILSPVHILTAAHCVSDSDTKSQPKPEDLMPTVGAHYSSKDSSHGEQQRLKVKKVSVYPDWFKVKHSLQYDIAILHLETPIKFSKWVGPVCLTPEEPPIVNQYIRAIGWGLIEDQKSPDILREADVMVMDSALCNNDKKEICFRTVHSTASCNGDSGGPYVWADPETNRYTQVALVSYGVLGESGNPFACDGKRFGGTSTAYFFDWIQQTMRETSPDHSICRKQD